MVDNGKNKPYRMIQSVTKQKKKGYKCN